MNKRPKDFVAGILVFGQLDGRREQFPASVVDAVADADADADVESGVWQRQVRRLLADFRRFVVDVDVDDVIVVVAVVHDESGIFSQKSLQFFVDSGG